METFARSAGVARARSEVEEHHRRTAAQLEVALESRVLVEQAKGFLSAVRDIDPGEAFEQIRSYARSHRLKAQEVARAVVERRLLP